MYNVQIKNFEKKIEQNKSHPIPTQKTPGFRKLGQDLTKLTFPLEIYSYYQGKRKHLLQKDG